MAKLSCQVPGLFIGYCFLFHSLSLSLKLMPKAKFNLIRRIMCLINFIFNIQTEAFPLSMFIKDVLGGMLMSYDIINT